MNGQQEKLSRWLKSISSKVLQLYRCSMVCEEKPLDFIFKNSETGTGGQLERVANAAACQPDQNPGFHPLLQPTSNITKYQSERFVRRLLLGCMLIQVGIVLHFLR